MRMLNEQGVLEILGEVEAFMVGGHFVYKSGLHGEVYVNKDALYPYAEDTLALCFVIAQMFSKDDVEVVVGPEKGGIILSQWVSYHLTKMSGHDVLGIYAEKETVPVPDPEGKGRAFYYETGRFVIKRDYDKLIADKRVLVVEDVLTTGDSAKSVIEAARAIGGNVLGLGVLVNRGGVTSQDVADVPKLFALVNSKLEAWDAKDCPLCRKGIPVNTSVGKGSEFLAKKLA